MDPTYSAHAKLRMAERGITKEMVEAVLRRHIGPPTPGSRPDTVELQGFAPGGRHIKVVVDSVDRERVVTIHDIGGPS